MRGSSRIAGIVAAAFTLLVSGPSTTNALLSSLETKCASTIGKSAAKLAKTYAKEDSKCRDADISQSAIGSCPNMDNQTKIDTIASSVESSVLKKCKSTCEPSGLECISGSLCPPYPTLGVAETCTGEGSFDIKLLGFPGAFCAATLSGPMEDGADVAECINERTVAVAASLTDAIYGSITSASNLDSNTAACLKGISKAAQKLSSTIYKGVVKCRDAINKGKLVANPATCTKDDPKLAEKIQKAEDKLQSAVNGCTDDQIQDLDLCMQGPGVVASTADAYSCLKTAVEQITDTNLASVDRTYSKSTLVEAAYPPAGQCGDGVINQLPGPFLLLGEECDLDDDDACPNNCFPPGDTFECTCAGNAKRIRFLADGFTADLDNGFTGTSHNSGVTDKAGFITTFSSCDCDDMTGATCTGTSSDPVCDVNGKQQPTCSWDPLGSQSCDQHGSDIDTLDEDSDCYICDQYALNAGDSCVDETSCTPQCYPIAGGAPTGTCLTGQDDCAPTEICRGQCDRSQTCIVIPNGAPLPIVSGGSPVCILTTFREDIFGTQNIVTGEHAINIQQYSKVHLGEGKPCPVCGGACNGGPRVDAVCEGTCSLTPATQCRFDDDCPSGETCTAVSPQCPDSTCNLSLVCNGGADDNAPCRISADTGKYGTTSANCRPNSAQNISANGLAINFMPQTSEAVSLPASLPCQAPGFENYDCPCPGLVGSLGARSKPNLCAYACNAGAEFGVGCANGGGVTQGSPTKCVGGTEAGKGCDEDSDCSGGGTCTSNPTHCVGDPAYDRVACTTNGDCGGIATCEDACPSGKCVPLCLPSNDPLFPVGAGRFPDDPEEGLCAAGPSTYHCSSPNFDYVQCESTGAESNCVATCSVSNAPCDPLNPCPPGDGVCTSVAKICSNAPTACTTNSDCSGGGTCTHAGCEAARYCEAGADGILGNSNDTPGAGVCVEDVRNCFQYPIAAEGGDTYNGNGDPTNARAVSVFCIPPTASPTINNTAGLGGPGRLRQNGENVSNGFLSLP